MTGSLIKNLHKFDKKNHKTRKGKKTTGQSTSMSWGAKGTKNKALHLTIAKKHKKF